MQEGEINRGKRKKDWKGKTSEGKIGVVMQNEGTRGARRGCGRVGDGIQGLGLPWDGGVGQEVIKRRERREGEG